MGFEDHIHRNIGGPKEPFAVSVNGFKLWVYQTRQPNSDTYYIPFLPGTDASHLTEEHLSDLTARLTEMTNASFSTEITPTPEWSTFGATEQLVVTIHHQNPTPEQFQG